MKNERHKCQDIIVDLIEHALTGIESGFELGIREAEECVTQVSVEQGLFDVAVVDARAALEASQYHLVRSKEIHADNALMLRKAVNDLEGLQGAICKSEVESDGIYRKRERLEAMMSRSFLPLRLGTVERPADTKRLISSVVSFGSGLQIDMSLMKALSETLHKPLTERGSFDMLTIQHFEDEIAKHKNKFSEALELLSVDKDHHEKAKQISVTVHDEAREKCSVSEEHVMKDEVRRRECEEALKMVEHQAHVCAHKLIAAMSARDVATKRSRNFQTGSLAAFHALKQWNDVSTFSQEIKEEEESQEAMDHGGTA